MITNKTADLRAALAKSEAENDQWQKKLAGTWAELAEERQWRQELADLSVDQQREIERLKAEVERLQAPTPMPDEGNVICVRIGDYYTVVPLSESTDVALAQIEGPGWQETGTRFARLQRAVDRSSQAS